MIGDAEDDVNVIIQGYELDAGTLAALGPVPQGEQAVRLPRAIILAAAKEIAESA